MAVTDAPGIHLTESLRPPLSRRVSVRQPVPVLIGESASGPGLQPVLVNSWREFADLFGGFSYTDNRTPMWLGWGLHQHFQAGGSSAYIIRVVGQNATVASTNVNDRSTEPVPENLTQAFGYPAFAQPAFDGEMAEVTAPGSFKITAVSSGSSGNALRVIITDNVLGGARFNVDVVVNGVVLERWLNVVMTPTDGRYFPSVVNSDVLGSKYIRVEDTTTVNFTGPADGTYPLTGGSNGLAVTNTDYINAVALTGAVDASVLVAVPGNVNSAVQTALVNYCEARTNGFAILDGPDDSVTAMVNHAAALPTSSYGAIYYPWPVTLDPSANRSGATRIVPPSGAIIGRFQASDLTTGPQAPAAGTQAVIPGSMGLSQAVTLTQYGILNSNHVNGLRTIPGTTGVNIYGVRTLRKGTIDQYIGVRRTLIFVKQRLVDLLQFAVFRNNDPFLWSQVRAVCNEFLMSFWQAGGLRGLQAPEAFFVTCDSTNNPLSSIESGELHVDIGVALQTPAEFVMISIGLWEGGATVEEGTI